MRGCGDKACAMSVVVCVLAARCGGPTASQWPCYLQSLQSQSQSRAGMRVSSQQVTDPSTARTMNPYAGAAPLVVMPGPNRFRAFLGFSLCFK